jgi:hypothetical protein
MGPILSAVSQKEIVLDAVSLGKIGKILVKAVVEEAKKDFAKRGKSGLSDPLGLPASTGRTIRPSFFKSFSARVSGQKTLEIVSSWPWIEGLVQGRPRAAMTKHTQNNPKLRGKPIPFIQSNGKVLFRMAPLAFGKMWVHPGIAKHTFVSRGLARGRKQLIEQGMMMKIILEQIQRTAKE